MRSWKQVANAWDQGGLKDVCEEIPVHDPIKNANFALSLFADTCPHMYFDRVLGLGLRLWSLSLFTAAEPPVVLELDSALVSPQNVIKIIMAVPLSPF